jgi:hypothetical protein
VPNYAGVSCLSAKSVSGTSLASLAAHSDSGTDRGSAAWAVPAKLNAAIAMTNSAAVAAK